MHWSSMSTRPPFGEYVLTRLASVALLYTIVALVFAIMLGALTTREPVIVEYLTSGNAALSFLSAAEAQHMQDVRVLIAGAMTFLSVAVVYLFLFGQWRSIDKTVARDAFLMSIVLLVLLLPFQYTFDWFHRVFFPQGNWQFANDSWLIQHFPPAFFAWFASAWFVLSTLTLAVLWRELPNKKN